MKLKGKALLSLLMVLTLVLQLFSVSAFAEGQVNGSEPLIYAVYARDESGAVVQVSCWRTRATASPWATSRSTAPPLTRS